MTTQATAQRTESGTRTRSAVLLSLALGTALAGMVALAGTAREAEATFPGTNAKIAFASERTTGTGVDNPTGDSEIFTINPDGTGLKQLTFNTGGDYEPVVSPDGTKIAYDSTGDATTNPEGDYEIYLMTAADGSGNKNLTNNGYGVSEDEPDFSPDGQKIAYKSRGVQDSNLEGDSEVYSMNASDGSDQKNLTNNGYGVGDVGPAFSPGGGKITYISYGVQNSNLQGDREVYAMSATDGTSKKNLTNNAVSDDAATFSPDGTKIVYDTEGIQTSNLQGDTEIYTMSATDGTGKKNLTNNGSGVYDYLPIFSPDGKKIAYTSDGKQTSNLEGDEEIYRMNTLDGLGKKNVTNDAAWDELSDWGRQAM